MNKITTKQLILETALSLFSKEGYQSITVEVIAKEVDIKAPSLYKHYKSKQAIFEAIMEEMEKRYENIVSTLQMQGSDPTIDSLLFENINEETLISMGKSIFQYFLHDPYASKFRKLLTIEQYHLPELGKIYLDYYFHQPLNYQSILFQELIEKGVFKSENPSIMALHFYTPLYQLLTVCDHEPQNEQEIIEMLKQHIIQFNHLYKNKEKS